MAHFTKNQEFDTPWTIHSWMDYFPIGLASLWNLSLNPASSSWGTSNNGVYLPFILPHPYVVRRVFWFNGTSTTGNGCLAIYSEGGRQIYTTGATARAGASSVQYTTPANPILLQPGSYWLGLSIGTTTNAVFGSTSVTAAIARAMGIRHQAGVGTLPTAMTDVAPITAVYPLVGITRLAS